MDLETTSKTETENETSTTGETLPANQIVTTNQPGQSILTHDEALRMLEDVLGDPPEIDEPEMLVKLLLFLSDNFDHPGLKATIQTLVRAAFDNSIVRAIAFEEYVEAIRAGRNPLEILRATLLAIVRGELLDETQVPELTDVAAEGPRTTELHVKWAGIARLFLKGVATLTAQEIKDGVSECIEEAVADKDVDTLALLLRWLVAESEDTTIERFKLWLETADFITKQEPPTNGSGGRHG